MSTINKYTRVNAFTILEMLIGLVISAIIVSMVYFIYSNIYRQIFQYSDQQVELMEYNQFQNLLSSDIGLSNHVKTIDQRHLKLIMKEEQEIDYFFYEKYIVRSAKTQDTFNMNVKSIELSLEGDIGRQFTTVKLTTKLLDQEILIFEQKEISLVDKINDHFLEKK